MKRTTHRAGRVAGAARRPLTKLWRPLGWAALLTLTGGALAAPSYCTATYGVASNNTIGFYNFTKNTYVPVFTDATNINTNSNSLAVNPANGYIYFIYRGDIANNAVVSGSGRLRYINPDTKAITTVGAVPDAPNGGSYVGGTFDKDGKYYVYASGKIAEMNISTGAIVGTFKTLTAPTGAGYTLNGNSNGDFSIDKNGQLYIIVEANTDGSTTFNPYLWKLDFASAALTEPVSVKNGATIWGGTVNGLSTDPYLGTFLVSSGTGPARGGTAAGIYELNPTSGAATLRTSVSGMTDLANCGSVPEGPTFTKAFSPATITSTSDTATLTLNVINSNLSSVYTNADLVDTLPTTPGTMRIAATPNIGGSCVTAGNTVTAVANAATVTLAAGSRIPSGGCTVTVSVQASAIGTYTNTVPAGALDTTTGVTAGGSTATLTVGTSLTLSKTVDKLFAVYPSPVNGAEPVPPSLTYTIAVKNTSTVEAQGVTLTDTLPTGIGAAAVTEGGAAVASTRSGQTLSWTVGTVAAGATRTYTVTTSAPTAPTLRATQPQTALVNSVAASATNAPTPPTATATTNTAYTGLFKQLHNIGSSPAASPIPATSPAWTSSGTGLPQDVLEYCIDFTNYGSTALSNYKVTDTVATNTAVVSGTTIVKQGNMQTSPTTAYPGASTSTVTSAGVSTVTATIGTLPINNTGSLCFRTRIN